MADVPRGAERPPSEGEPASDRRPLRASLVAGAIYDLALGITIVFLGPWMLEALGYPLPDPIYLFLLSSLALFLLPALYLAAARARAVDVFRLPVLWARIGGGGLVILFALLFPPPGAWIYQTVGFLDLVWAAVHVALWNRGRSRLADATLSP